MNHVGYLFYREHNLYIISCSNISTAKYSSRFFLHKHATGAVREIPRVTPRYRAGSGQVARPCSVAQSGALSRL